MYGLSTCVVYIFELGPLKSTCYLLPALEDGKLGDPAPKEPGVVYYIIHMYVYVVLSLSLYIYIYLYIHMYIYIYIYTYTYGTMTHRVSYCFSASKAPAGQRRRGNGF